MWTRACVRRDAWTRRAFHRAGMWLVAALLAIAAAAATAPSRAAPPAGATASPQALPFTLRPGDVVANAPLGVLRAVVPVTQKLAYSPSIGVWRAPPPPSLRVQPLWSGATTVLRGPAVAAVLPSTVSTGVTAQSVVLAGRGLNIATTASLEPAEGISVVSFDVAADGSQVEVSLDVAADAVAGLRKLRLRSADGRVIPALSPAAEQLLVAADVPVVESVTPSLARRGDVHALVIRGRNLRGLPFATASRNPEQPRVRMLPADGISISETTVSNDAGTEVRVEIRIAADAPLDARVVQVQTLSGDSSTVPTPGNTLRLSDAPLATLSPFVAPLVGVLRESPVTLQRVLFTGALGVVRGPHLSGMSPASVELGSQVTLRLAGRGLSAATGVLIAPADGIAVVPGSLSAGDAEVTVEITVAEGAPLFARRIELVLPDRVLRAPRLLQVRDAMPELTALTPNYLVRDGQNQTIEIQGRALSQTTAARLLPDQGVIIDDYEAVDATHARMVLRAAPDAASGPRVLQVESAERASGLDPADGNTLYIRDRVDVLTPVVAPVVGVLRAPPASPRSVSARSPLLGVVRGAYAHELQPALWRRGITTRVSVLGRGLQDVDAVDLPGSEGVSIAALQVEPDGSGLSFDAIVASDAPPGSRRVRLRAGAVEVGFVPPTSALAIVDDNSAVGPDPEPDFYTGLTNGVIDIAADAGVLANDVDPTGGTLSAILRRLPASGTLELRVDGSFTYRPNADFAGVDRFEYSPGNATTLGAATVVTLTVTERDDALDDAYLARDDETLVVAAAQGLLANDRLAAGDPPQIVLDSQPALGQLQLAADGGFSYVPQRQSGTDTFSYRLEAGGVRSRPAQVRITIQDINQAPLARDDAYVGDRGETMQVAANRGVLANDSDPDGDTLQARVTTNPAVGALALSSDGGFVFTPPQDFIGETSFTYEAFDTRGLRATASVRLTVNDTLAAADDAYAMNEGEVLFVDEADGLLANDSLYPQGTLRIVLDAPPVHGIVQLADDGSFVYTPASSDYSGLDSFRYRLRDNVVTSPPATVTITLRGVDDPPVATTDRYLTDENADLTIPAPGVLANDEDVDSATLSAQLTTPPQHGVATLAPDGRLTYVPEVNYRGTDAFEYAASDGNGLSAPVRVEIQVTQPPTATNDVYLVDIDEALDIIDPLQGLLVNDHDAPERDRLYALLDQGPKNGTLSLNENGTFRYVPNPGYQGLDVWTYQVTDTRSESNVATVTMAVGITSLPRAVPDAYAIDEDGELVVGAVEGLLANDLDADTPRAQLEAYLVGYAEGLSVSVNRDGSFRARPPGNFYGETFFVYQVYDGTDISNSAIVTITVNPTNDGVDARDDRFGVLRNTVFESTGGRNSIPFNDSYDRDFEVNYELVQAPQYGVAQIDSSTGRLRYTPQQDFSGSDQLTYRLFQVETGISDTATVTLRVNAPPVAGPDQYSVTEDTISDVSPGLLANDTDADGDPLALLGTSFTAGASNVYVATVSVDSASAPTRTTVNAYNHFYGSVDLSYRITDGTQDDVGQIRLVVQGVADAPVAAANDYLTQRNTPLSVSSVAQGVLNNDFDPDARPYAGAPVWAAASGVDLQPLRAERVQDVQHGTLTLAETGTFYYVPENGFSGIDEFRYQVRDGTGRTSAPVRVTIRVNTPPTAVDDAYVASEDTVLVVAVADGVLANDTDSDGDVLQVNGSSCSPCNGRVQIAADGSFRYTPDRDFHGSDEFFYSVRDGISGSDTGRVTITVLPVNDPPLTDSDTYRTREDEVLVAPEPQGVLRNDREVDGDALVRSELTQAAAHGAVEYQSDGSFSYTPGVDFSGSDGFRYRVYDSTGLSSEEVVEIQVTPVNDAPDALDDAYEVALDQVLEVTALDGVLGNDSDVDGPSLTASVVAPPQHGELDLQPDGSFRYVPDGVFSGIDRFQYQLDDGLGALDVGNVLIEVQPVDPSVEVWAESDFYRFPGPQFTLAAPGVLANDAIEGPGMLAARLVLPPQVGSVSLAADGSFTYTAPDGYAGLATFSYAAEAGGSSAVAQVTLDVQRVGNVPPQARGEQFGVLEDGQLDSRLVASLLANDSDYEGQALTLEMLEPPAHGALQWLGRGHFLYDPAPDFHGSDRIRYRVSDGEAWSAPVFADITVFAQNDAPIAAEDAYQTEPDTALVVATAQGVLANDVDIDDDALMVELVDAPRRGALVMDPEGGFTYTPLPGESGADSFRYAASDLLALSTATVHLNISAGNRPPLAEGEQWRIDEDQVADSVRFGLLTANDTDPDGDALGVRLLEAPLHGTLQLDGAAFTYRPAPNWHGDDQFVYTVSDGALEAPPVAARIQVAAVNDAPLAEADLYATIQDVPLQVAAAEGVLANDRDIEDQPLTLSLLAAPSHGRVTLAADGGFDYVPAAAYSGRDEFSYTVSDGEHESVGRVVIDVTRAANARPIAVGERYSLAEDSVLDTRALQSLLHNDRDPEGQGLTLVPVAASPRGTVEWLAGGHLRYVPARDHVEQVVIPYAVSDGELTSEPASVVIDFSPSNDAPQATSDVYHLAPGASRIDVSSALGLLANDRDPDGDTLVVTLLAAPATGTLELDLDGALRYTPATPVPLQDEFRYRVSDAGGLTADAGVLLLMDPQAAPVRLFNDSFEPR